MKHIAILSLLTLNSSLLTLHAAVPLKWTVETSRAVPAQFEAYQGETLALEAALQSYGKPLEAPLSYSLYWQTNGMGNAYWSTPCTVPASSLAGASNVLFATWSPTNDVGARVYNCFIGQPGTIYHAAFQLRLRPSPGATPNELPLPQKVIDFAKVTVLNPPWSGGGGGGGVNTNAVIDIVHKTVDGSARTLPHYLHYLEMDDTYPDAAAEYYRSRGNGRTDGGCSSVRSGGFLYRNFDYPFDDRAEFVVKMSAGPNRFASVGVAQVGTNLTEQMVTSGKWSKWYKALPGATVDGINENGVACNINVVDGDPQWGGGVSPALHPLAAVRWILDNATNAEHAATYVASHIAFPSGWTQNFHYMVCDERETWIVENGSAHDVTDGVKVLTNFRLYPTRDTTGEGQERYDALSSGENITSQWWTLTYTQAGYRASDLPGITGEDRANLFNYWENNPREAHRGETFPTGTGTESHIWWQTLHTSVYDLATRTLRICVQERGDWYTFAVDQANVDLSPIEAQIAALQDGKKDNFAVGKGLTETKIAGTHYRFRIENPTFGLPDFCYSTVENPTGGTPAYADIACTTRLVEDGEGSVVPFYFTLDYGSIMIEGGLASLFGVSEKIALKSEISADVSATDLASKQSKITASGVLKGDGSGGVIAATKSSTSADPANADYRDPQDNTCHKTELTDFVYVGDDDNLKEWFASGKFKVEYDGDGYWLYRHPNGFPTGYTLGRTFVEGNGDELVLNCERVLARMSDESSVNVVATRSAVCTDGEKFVTSDVVDGKVSAAVSTNNPAFSNAVLQVQANEFRKLDDEYVYLPAGFTPFTWHGDRQDAIDALGNTQPYEYAYGDGYSEFSIDFPMGGGWYWGYAYDSTMAPEITFHISGDWFDPDTGEYVYDYFDLVAKRTTRGYIRQDPIDTFAHQSQLTTAVRAFNAMSNSLYVGETKRIRTGESDEYGTGWGYFRRPVGSDFRHWRIVADRMVTSGYATTPDQTMNPLPTTKGTNISVTAMSNPFTALPNCWTVNPQITHTEGTYGTEKTEFVDYEIGFIRPYPSSDTNANNAVRFRLRNISRDPRVYEVTPIIDGMYPSQISIGGRTATVYRRDLDLGWMSGPRHVTSGYYRYYHTKIASVAVEPVTFMATNSIPLVFYSISTLDKETNDSNPDYSYESKIYTVENALRTFNVSVTFNPSYSDSYILPAGRVVTGSTANLFYDAGLDATFRIAVSNGCYFSEHVIDGDWRKEGMLE